MATFVAEDGAGYKQIIRGSKITYETSIIVGNINLTKLTYDRAVTCFSSNLSDDAIDWIRSCTA